MSSSTLTPEDILPHRGAMLLVDDILQVDSSQASALFRPAPHWPLAEEKGVAALLMVEMAAQAAGLCSGYGRIQQRGKDADQSGWLVGIKKADFFVDLLPFHTPVTAQAQITFTYDSLREVSCTLSHDTTVLGRVVLQLFKEEDDQDLTGVESPGS